MKTLPIGPFSQIRSHMSLGPKVQEHFFSFFYLLIVKKKKKYAAGFFLARRHKDISPIKIKNCHVELKKGGILIV